jgi:hypothetical protein
MHSWSFIRARVRFKRRFVAVIASCTIALVAYAEAQTPEYAVKSAYLFNFGKFLRFAPSEAVESRQSFDICVVGNDPFGGTLDELTANEQLDNKAVRVVRLKSGSEARGCAIAYISAAEGDRVERDLEAVRGHQVLTVSDAQDFLRRGGMIQFITVGDHVRFAVNLDAVRSAQINLSSELLKVAISTDGKTSPGVGR